MIGYDRWHWPDDDKHAFGVDHSAEGSRDFSVTIRVRIEPADVHREALIDIAHDCGTLEAAQRRAKQALIDGDAP